MSSNDNNNIDKGFNLLELASGIVPQGRIVTVVSESWKLAWKRMMIELAPQDSTGNYVRPKYTFSNEIGLAESRYPDEPGRYHIYTGNPCPWCHRVVIAMKVLGYKPNQIGWTVLEDNPREASRGGWIFSKQRPDRMFGGKRDLRELYQKLEPGYKGRCTAPLLVDIKTQSIVSNESADIVRMLNRIRLDSSSREAVTDRINLIPPGLQLEIDTANEWIYRLLNNGVYRCGFATSQDAYNKAVADVQQGLQLCESILSVSTYLCCNEQITEADVRLLPTLLRFDGVYNPLFIKGTICLRADYPNIQRYMKQCWRQYPELRNTIDLQDACSSYYKQLFPLNPGGIVPLPVTSKTIGLE